jgi:GMP synthase (glutamine-hydrolysing)
MRPPTPRLLLVVTGGTVPSVEEDRGDFIPIFTKALQSPPGDPRCVVIPLDIRDADESDPLPDLELLDGVIVTGSPAMVGDDEPWMRYGVRLVKHALENDVPLLGVCFGHQLIGVAAGADVGPNPQGREMGSVEVEVIADEHDPLLGGLPQFF